MYKHFFFLAAASFSVATQAQPHLITEQGPASTRYTPIVVVYKKLRTSLEDAKAEFPGEEYIVASDRNASLTHAPAVFNGLWTYDNVSTVIYGFGKQPRVDGLKTTGIANFVNTGTYVSPTYPVDIDFTGPTSEFGVVLGTTNSSGGIFTDAVTVKVDGVELGTINLPAFQATFVGVRDDDAPLGRVTFVPSKDGNYDYVAPFVSDGFYIETAQ
ncbi:MAG: hypothetical protein ACU84J_09940 [Gammaproteobacteria bacterium]